MTTLYLVLSGISLAVCTAVPFLYFWGSLSQAGFKTALALGSVAWFVFATLWAGRRKRA